MRLIVAPIFLAVSLYSGLLIFLELFSTLVKLTHERSMKGQELILVFRDDLAFLTEEVALDFKQVDISSNPVRFQAPAFWTIRVINFIEDQNWLFVEVLAYQVGERSFPANQLALADTLITIEKITIKSIDTTGLLRTLNSRGPMKILAPKPETIYRNDTHQREPIRQRLSETFSVPVKNITFVAGGVVFEKKFPNFRNPVSFQIANENIIEEFDAVKNCFASALGTKKIEVVATIETTDGVITEVKAGSAEIDRIDNRIIEEAKLVFVKSAKVKETTSNTQLFTMEEYFETFTEGNTGSQPFYTDDTQFLEDLLKISNTKHYMHLRFLSSKHRVDLTKLRFIQKPFSFIFLLSGTDTFHFIWETLDTQEATYIWSASNDPSLVRDMLSHVDKTIRLIKGEGKNEYIGRDEENFSRVFHDYTDPVTGFRKWKEELEQVIQQ